MNKLVLCIGLIILTASPGFSQTTEWKVDKSHSQITFTVAHLVISEVSGFFKDFDVTLVADKSDFTDAKIDVTIKTQSIDTGNERRDNHVRGDDFLNTKSFPEMKFKSTKIEKSGDNGLTITGDLTIRDVTKSIVLDTKYKGSLNDAQGTRAVFKATTTVDRFEFGAKWDKTMESGGLVAGKDIEITLSMEFMKPASKN